jgi:tetratricopeptide (TPR) repeat protein
LIRAADGFHLWSEVYDRHADDLLDVQRDVAEQVAAALDVLLDEERRSSMFATGTRNFAAFEAFMRGNEAFRNAHMRDPAYEATLAEANAYFERAIELDPGFAMAAVLHADRYAHVLLEGHAAIVGNAAELKPAEALLELRSDLHFAADNAPDDMSRVIAELNLVFFSPGWQHMPLLLSELEALVRAGRRLPPISLWLHEILLLNGKIELAELFAKDLQAVDPLNSAGWVDEVEIAVWQHDLDKAARLLGKSRARFGPVRPLPEIEVTIALLQDDTEKAIELLEKIDDTGRDIVFFPPLLAALRGDADEAVRLAEEFEAAAMRPGRSMLEVYYRLADVDRLRDTLRHIDGLPAGPAILSLELIHTAGSIPLPVESMPNLQRRFAEAGIEIAALLQR